MSSYYAVRHRERTDVFLDNNWQWVAFQQAKLLTFSNVGVLNTFVTHLRPEVELVEVYVVPVRRDLS